MKNKNMTAIQIILLVYTLLCSIISSFVSDVNRGYKTLIVSCYDTISGKNGVVEKSLFIFFFTIILLIILPLLFFLSPLALFKMNKREIKDDGNLYFCKMGGAGTIYCNDCGYKEHIISFTHGDGSTSGYQCQVCGKFHAYYSDDGGQHRVLYHPDENTLCECGSKGSLNREKSLFCPKCKSKKLSYSMAYIT